MRMRYWNFFLVCLPFEPISVFLLNTNWKTNLFLCHRDEKKKQSKILFKKFYLQTFTSPNYLIFANDFWGLNVFDKRLILIVFPLKTSSKQDA